MPSDYSTTPTSVKTPNAVASFADFLTINYYCRTVFFFNRKTNLFVYKCRRAIIRFFTFPTIKTKCSILLFRCVFTQGLRVVLELHQHSAAQKLSREVQQVSVVEEHDEFLKFSGHGDDDGRPKITRTIVMGPRGTKIKCETTAGGRAAAVYAVCGGLRSATYARRPPNNGPRSLP